MAGSCGIYRREQKWYYFEDVGVDGGIILKTNLDEKDEVTWTGLTAPVEEQLASCCEYGDELHSFIKCREFFVSLRKCWPQKKDCTAWSWLVGLFNGWLVSQQTANCYVRKNINILFIIKSWPWPPVLSSLPCIFHNLWADTSHILACLSFLHANEKFSCQNVFFFPSIRMGIP